jgi:hypothetical protein
MKNKNMKEEKENILQNFIKIKLKKKKERML